MDEPLRTAVEQLIRQQTGCSARIVAARPVSGGCIHRAEVVELADERRFFVKSNPAAPPGIFKREAEGLADFGRRFAHLHRCPSPIKRYGFDHDNHIGATPQPNPWTDDWTDFFRRHRLGHQLDLARSSGLTDRAFDRLGDRLLVRLDPLIGQPDEPPCLLHGDLWSGNYMVDDAGKPVLIDPAAYYGRREADLAMTQLFGGFDNRFYAAYEEIWPLAPGSDERLEIYKLYHLLNHLNLFGDGYRDSCVAIMQRFA